MKLGYMAIGHNGTTLHLSNPDKPPRGQLLAKLGATHAKKVYADRVDGKSHHVGYVVGNEWFHVYEVHEWTGKAD